MTYDEAQSILESRLGSNRCVLRKGSEFAFGWMFCVGSKAYAEARQRGDPDLDKHIEIGTGPFLLCRRTGEITQCGSSAHPRAFALGYEQAWLQGIPWDKSPLYSWRVWLLWQ